MSASISIGTDTISIDSDSIGVVITRQAVRPRQTDFLETVDVALLHIALDMLVGMEMVAQKILKDEDADSSH